MTTTHPTRMRRRRADVADWRRPGLLAVVACIALCLGVLVYLTDRVPSQALLVPDVRALTGRHLFGAIGQWLPSFVHPLAFGLLTAAALPPRSAWRVPACLLWGGVNLAFELGQHTHFRGSLAALLQAGPAPAWLTRPLANYFLHGTYDPFDMLAVVAGASTGAAVLCLIDHRGDKHHAR